MTTLKHIPPPLNKGKSGYPWTTKPAVPQSNLVYPKISIVTPSYQQGVFLEETIRSVLMQGYPSLEYIIMDGGSTDETVKIIEYYSDFITYWVSEKDNGQSDAIAQGFSRTTGDIMGWLNSDDILLPNALFMIAKYFITNESAKIVTGLRQVFNVDSKFIYNSYHGRPTSDYVRHICEIFQETTYWRREVWEKVGTIDSQFQFAMDYEYWQRIIHAGYKFVLIPQYLGGFRIHDRAKGSTMISKRNEELENIYRRYKIALNEEDAIALYMRDYDPNWSKRIRLLRDIGHWSFSNTASFVIWLDDIFTLPVIGGLILRLHNIYRRLRGRYYER